MTKKRGEEEEKEQRRPFFPCFIPRGVAAGNGEMVCFDQGCAHVVAVVTARTRRVVVLDGGGVGRQAGRASCHSERAAVDRPKKYAAACRLGSCMHLGAEVAVVVAGEAVRVVDLKRGGEAREVCRESGGPGASDLFGSALLDTVLVRTTAGSWAVAMAGGGEEEEQENRSSETWQCARAIVEGDEGERVFAGVSGRQRATKQHRVTFCSGQRRQTHLECWCQSACRVRMSRRSLSLGVAGEDCSTRTPFVVCFSLALQLLSTRSQASSSHMRGA